MNKIYLIVALFNIINHVGAQLSHDYSYGFGGTGADDARATATDSQGNVYVAGYFSNTVDFNPSSATFTMQSQGAEDAYIAEFDMNGNFLNAVSFGNNLNCKIFGLATDSQDNLFITGAFTGAVDFDPSSNVTQLTAGGYYDIFIVKLSSNQGFQWAQRIGNASYDDYAYSVTCDKNDNVLVTGYFNGTNVDFDPASITQYNLSSQSGRDIFVLKLNNNGAFQWAIDIGGPGFLISDEANVVKTDAGNNVFVGGYFGGTIDFDPGPGTQTIAPSGNIDAFVAKYSPTGSYVWAKNFSGPGNENTFGLTIDANDDVYCTGYFMGTVDFDASSVATATHSSYGAEDVFLTKYSSSGSYLWSKSFGSVGQDIGTTLSANNQTITIGGYYQSVVDFNPSASTNTFVSMGGSTDGFISQFDQNGNYLSTYAFGGPFNDFLYSVSTNTLGEIFTCGTYTSNIDFDSGPAVNTYTSSGNNDAYLLKLNNSAVGINEIELDNSLASVYPNPAGETIRIRSNSILNEVEISDAAGKVILQDKFNSLGRDIDISSLNDGIYILKITSNQKAQYSKLIKQ